MSERTIDDFIFKELSLEDQKTALSFIKYLRENDVQFIKADGYWKDKIYYLVKLDDEYICFILINNPDEEDNRWTVWSDDIKSLTLEDISFNKELKETAWKHIDNCGNCGSCGGGRHKIVFGKEFDKVCGCTFRIDNPTWNDLEFMKKIVEIKIKEILDKTKS